MGAAALGMLAPQVLRAAEKVSAAAASKNGPIGPYFAPKAKQVIYLHMVGGPPQMDLYDYKPVMGQWFDKDLPDSVRMGQRLTTMTSGQTRFPIAPSKYKFAQHGKGGMWFSELLPWTAKVADEMCFVRSMHTEAINHEPAITYMQTGNQITGRPCMGSWVSYGLGSLNRDLPTFVVLIAKPSNTEQVQAISGKLWSSGYLSGEHAGVSFRTAGDPILYINNPAGVDAGVPCRQNARWPPRGTQPAQLPRSRRIPKPTRASSNTNSPSACNPACRNSPIPRRNPSPPTSFSAWMPRSPALFASNPRCSPAAWLSAASASSKFITTTGTPTATSPAASPCNARTWTRPATA